nr:hypothetical protein [Limosilactobacillus mucosae]
MEKIKLSAAQSHKLTVVSDEAFYASKYALNLPKKVALKQLTENEFIDEVSSINAQLDLAKRYLIEVAGSIVDRTLIDGQIVKLQKAVKDAYWEGYEDGLNDTKKDDKEEPKHD